MDFSTLYSALCPITYTPLRSQSTEFEIALVGGLAGGVLALIGSLAATWLTEYFNKQKNQQDKQDLLQSTLEAIATELQALFGRYQETAGQYLAELPPNSPFNYYYFATENYITIFDNNSRLLGHLIDKSLRDLIIRTYIDIKSLLDGFKLNNTMYGNYETLTLYDAQASSSLIKNKLVNLEIARKNLGNQLKKEHTRLSVQIPVLVQRIEEVIKMGVF
jgi:hypothetical protein